MKLSVLFPETRSVAAVQELAVRSEELGFHGLFLGSAFGFDPVMALALAGPHTSRILLGTAVVPTWPRHPIVAAQQAATANAACGGRFRFGVGPSHVPVMGMYGIAYEKPVGHVREYLTIVRSLLRDGNVRFKGEHYRVMGFLDVEGGGTPPVLLAALHEQLCRTAGGHADGVLPWLAPAAHVASTIVPNVRKGAETAGREAPPVVAEIPVVVSGDRDAVMESAIRELAMYLNMPFYADLLVQAGVPGAADAASTGWTPAMVDAVVPWGDEDALAAKLQAYFDAGADELVVSPIGVGPDPAASVARSLEVLGDIARG